MVNNEEIEAQFKYFALECEELEAPLYASLSDLLSQDESIHRLLSGARKQQPIANLFFAAVKYLLRTYPEERLAVDYLNAHRGETIDPKDVYRHLQEFCLRSEKPLNDVIGNRFVQTNVANRCAYLLPAFKYISSISDGKPISFVEIGCSAGLNLLWDKYRYTYSDGTTFGDAQSTVHLNSRIEGTGYPSMDVETNEVAGRFGVDLNPIDVADENEVDWLRALVWPERQDESEILECAVSNAKEHKDEIKLFKGEMLDVLPKIFSDHVTSTNVCVFDSHVMNQIPNEDRQTLSNMLKNLSSQVNIFHVSIGGQSNPPEIRLSRYCEGIRYSALLGYSDAHGRWSRWVL